MAAQFEHNWNTLKEKADTDDNGRISKKEWIAYTESMLETKSGYSALVDSLASSIFDIFDKDQNDSISTPEYSNSPSNLEK